MSAKTNPLFQQAINAMTHSYSPYSNRKVGAAILLENGTVWTGCNIENSSFGATVCAERVATWRAIAEIGPGIRICEVAVATEASPPWSPCGICLQVMNEFIDPTALVHRINEKNEVITEPFKKLFPRSFDRF